MLHCGEGRGWRWAMAKVGQTCQGFEGRPRVIEMTWEANEEMNKKKRLSMTLRSELMNDIHLFCEWWVVWRMHFESVLGLRGHLAMTQFAQCIALWMSCKVRLKGIDKIKFGHTQCMHCLVRGWIPVIMFVGWNHIWWCWGDMRLGPGNEDTLVIEVDTSCFDIINKWDEQRMGTGWHWGLGTTDAFISPR